MPDHRVTSGVQMMRKPCDKMLHIGIAGEEVLGDAQPVAPPRDIDAVLLYMTTANAMR